MMGDTPITGPSADRGVVFQTPTLYPWLNIYQNVEYGPKMRKVPKDEREAGVKKYLELVGLKDFAKQKPHEAESLSCKGAGKPAEDDSDGRAVWRA